MEPHTTWQWFEGMIKARSAQLIPNELHTASHSQPHTEGTSSCERCPGVMGKLLQKTPWPDPVRLATSFISEEA